MLAYVHYTRGVWVSRGPVPKSFLAVPIEATPTTSWLLVLQMQHIKGRDAPLCPSFSSFFPLVVEVFCVPWEQSSCYSFYLVVLFFFCYFWCYFLIFIIIFLVWFFFSLRQDSLPCPVPGEPMPHKKQLDTQARFARLQDQDKKAVRRTPSKHSYKGNPYTSIRTPQLSKGSPSMTPSQSQLYWRMGSQEILITGTVFFKVKDFGVIMFSQI